MATYKAVIFDMGDVLFSWNPQSISQIPVRKLVGMTKSTLWPDFERGKIPAEECHRRLGEMFSMTENEVAAMFKLSTGSLVPNPEMTHLVRDLKHKGNMAVYMMTNIPRPDYDQLRSMDYVWDEFDGVFASALEGMRKPDLCFYQLVLDKIGLLPEQTIFVDDKLENVDAARELGMVGVQCLNVQETCETVRNMVQLDTSSLRES